MRWISWVVPLLLISPEIFPCENLLNNVNVVGEGIASSISEAREIALLNYTQKLGKVHLLVSEKVKNGVYEKEIQSVSSAWNKDFFSKSCKEGNLYKVSVYTPLRDSSYYPFPWVATRSFLEAMDKGYGVDVVHITSKVEVNTPNPTFCLSNSAGRFCFSPVKQNRYLSLIAKDNSFRVFSSKDSESKRGRISVTAIGESSEIDVTDLVVLELIRRGEYPRIHRRNPF